MIDLPYFTDSNFTNSNFPDSYFTNSNFPDFNFTNSIILKSNIS
ncbi:pentapeptide repeat-containing protein [Hungatella effluvii]